MANNKDNNNTADWGSPIRYIKLVTKSQQIDELSEILDDDYRGTPYWRLFAVELGEKESYLKKVERMVSHTMKSGGREILNGWQHTQQATIQNYIQIFQKIDCKSAVELIAQWILTADSTVVPLGHPLRSVFFCHAVIESGPRTTTRFDFCTTLIQDASIEGVEYAALPDHLFWPPQTALKIFFLETNEPLQNKIMEYTRIWTEHSGIKFVETANKQESDIRITFTGVGCNTKLGRLAKDVPKDSPTMCLAGLQLLPSEAEIKRTILHEFGHALGLIHEHQRPDARIPWDLLKTVQYFREHYAWDSEKTIANVCQPKYGMNYRYKTSFDPKSIMMYPIPKELLDKRHPDCEQWLVDPMPSDLSEDDKQIFKDFYKLKK